MGPFPKEVSVCQTPVGTGMGTFSGQLGFCEVKEMSRVLGVYVVK